ncbi:MAG: leucine-rich repeat protein [Clostridia bacterium]|nr:leucine-rich repeat protein [Clostridia bacterium]
MKKKIILMLTLCVMLVCVFAISVSAVTTYNDAPARSTIEIKTDEIIEFNDGFTCPSAYVFKDQERIENNNSFESAMDFTYINGKTNKNYTYADVKGFDIPSGFTYIGLYAGSNAKAPTWITFPNTITGLGNAIFQNSSTLEECTLKFDENNPMKNFPAYMFYGCSKLRAFSMPDCFTTLYDSNHFPRCTTMTAVYLSKNLTTWHSTGGSFAGTFDYCYDMYFVNEPFTYDSIPEKPTVYYFPKNLTHVESSNDFSKNSTMRSCTSLNDVLVFGTGVTSMTNEYFFQNGPENTVVFLGNMKELKIGNYWGTTSVYFANSADKSLDNVTYTLSPSNSSAKNLIFCYADGNATHLYLEELNREATCTVDGISGYACFCGTARSDATVVEAKGHDCTEVVKISYNGVNTFFELGDTTYTCGVCGEEHTVAGDRKVIFKSLGYSVTERNTGRYSITQGFVVDKDAMNEYNLYSENDVVGYGLVAGTVSVLGENADVFATDGTVNNQKAAIVDFMSRPQYDIFEIKISGLEGSNESYVFSEANIYCCGYCLVQIGDNIVSYYASEGTVTETLSMSTSYDTLKPVSVTE